MSDSQQLERAVQFLNPVSGELRWSKLTKRYRWEEEDRGYLTPWVWKFTIGAKGYGILRRDPRLLLAHRWVYEHLRGPIPAGLTLDHLCRVRCCVNPDHLEPVTVGENVLRGVGLSAQNARKTHCKHGHEFTPENTGIDGRGDRYCKRCSCDNARSYHEKRKAERPPRPARQDRRVHAVNATGTCELVRYAGPAMWYLETKDPGRHHVTMKRAADLAAYWQATGGTVYLGLPGGREFDSRVRRSP